MTGVLIRDVGISRDEFLRQLPDAIGTFSYHIDGKDIVLSDGDRRIDVKLIDEGTKKVGPMELPVQQVHFIFTGMSDVEARAFMEHWDQHKMRMGGG